MLRFLKWIFFIFGGLGLLIMSFFYIQNRKDLHLYFEHKSSLAYEEVSQLCTNKDQYYFNCFIEKFETYLSKVSLTGISLGLKTAFTFIDEDKKNNKKFTSKENDIRYGLNHLRLNNLVIENSTKRFHGLEFTYGGYIGKMKDFLDKAQDFSEGILEGLNGKEGISSIENESIKNEFFRDLKVIESDYQSKMQSSRAWLDAKISTLKEKHNVD